MPHPFSLWLYSPFFTKKEQGLKTFDYTLLSLVFGLKFNFIRILKLKTKNALGIF